MVKLVCYNIEYCEGMNGSLSQYLKFWRTFFPPRKLDRKIVESLLMLKPDILALVEVDTGSFRSKKDEVKFFEKELGMISSVEKIKYPSVGWLKLFCRIPILNKQANAIASKYKLKNIKYHLFDEGTKRVVIEASVNCPKKVTLLLTHLALGSRARKKQIAELIKIVNTIKNPVILMGDFNTFKGDIELKRILKETSLTDKSKLDKTSLKLTYPAYKPRKRFDYILTSPTIKVKKYKVLDFHFSDHLPLYVEFGFI